MNEAQQLAYDNPAGHADDIDDRFFHQIDNRVAVGLTVNR